MDLVKQMKQTGAGTQEKEKEIHKHKLMDGFDAEFKPIQSFFGFDYKYESETDLEEKYIVNRNKKFKKWSKI
jgi:hypothetical protein